MSLLKLWLPFRGVAGMLFQQDISSIHAGICELVLEQFALKYVVKDFYDSIRNFNNAKIRPVILEFCGSMNLGQMYYFCVLPPLS